VSAVAEPWVDPFIDPYGEEWSIGLLEGPSPVDLRAIPGVSDPVLTREHVTDVPAQFVADPFMVRDGGRWWMFFEVMNAEAGKGEIGLAASEDGLSWRYERIVLREEHHLSYPFVFVAGGRHFMVPESFQAGEIRLYEAVDFPFTWAPTGTLVTGEYLVDPTIVRHAGAWWLFAETNPELRHDTLRLFRSEALRGAWEEHPSSPVVAGDPGAARPAGRIVRHGGRLIRFAQDCGPSYGHAVHAFEISDLSASTYTEREALDRAVIEASGEGWTASGMHHVDAHRIEGGRWRAAVDGCRRWEDR
jgi:hypothetical protein